MRLAELSQRAGIPRSTIKFYLREGLLPAGAAHAKNQASYGSQHVERLALIRALREVAELPLDAVAKVTAELDRGWKGDPIGEAMRAMHTLPARGLVPGDAGELRRLTRRGARVHARAALDHRRRRGPLLRRRDRRGAPAGAAPPLPRLRRRRPRLARRDRLAALGEGVRAWRPAARGFRCCARGDDVAEPTRRAILGSVLFERIFAALRRSANAMRSVRIATGARVPAARVARTKRKTKRR